MLSKNDSGVRGKASKRTSGSVDYSTRDYGELDPRDPSPARTKHLMWFMGPAPMAWSIMGLSN